MTHSLCAATHLSCGNGRIAGMGNDVKVDHLGRVVEGECVIFVGTLTNSGYGSHWHKFDDGTVSTLAHRTAWRVANGPIPPGLTIDHLCRNKLCLNASHMEVVSRGENSRRAGGFAIASANARAATVCRNGHQYAEEGVYIDSYGRRTCRKCRRIASYNFWVKHRKKAA